METSLEDDHRGPAGGVARDLDRVLDRLGAGVQEDRLLACPPGGRELGEAAADLHVGLVAPDHEALVEVAVDLLVDRLEDLRVAVAEVLAADAAGEVEVLASLGVPDQRTPCTRHDERRGRHAAGDVLLSRLRDSLELAAFLQ